MKIFLDTANVEEISNWHHCIDGVTTNPVLLEKAGSSIEDVVNICSGLELSLEVGGDILEEARALYKISQDEEWNVHLAVKVPVVDPSGESNLNLVNVLSSEGILVNCTAIMSSTQAILAEKAGAGYVSFFAGRVDDDGNDWKTTAGTIATYLATINNGTEQIIGSVRSVGMVTDALLLGVNAVTVNPELMKKMINHPHSTLTSQEFEDAWKRGKHGGS